MCILFLQTTFESASTADLRGYGCGRKQQSWWRGMSHMLRR